MWASRVKLQLYPWTYTQWLVPGDTSRELVPGTETLLFSPPLPKDCSWGRSLLSQGPTMLLGEGQTACPEGSVADRAEAVWEKYLWHFPRGIRSDPLEQILKGGISGLFQSTGCWLCRTRLTFHCSSSRGERVVGASGEGAGPLCPWSHQPVADSCPLNLAVAPLPQGRGSSLPCWILFLEDGRQGRKVNRKSSRAA